MVAEDIAGCHAAVLTNHTDSLAHSRYRRQKDYTTRATRLKESPTNNVQLLQSAWVKNPSPEVKEDESKALKFLIWSDTGTACAESIPFVCCFSYDCLDNAKPIDS